MFTNTNSPDNVRLDGRGHLVIQAVKTPSGYTSGRLVTRGKVNMQYGTVSARIQLPPGRGIWPAFWMLGSDLNTAGWPECGEIDLIELPFPSSYQVSVHGPQGKSDNSDSGVMVRGSLGDLTNDFHEYWMNWQENSITVGVDQSTLATFTPSSLPPGAQWVFNHPMYAVLSIAVGNKVPPDESTPSPATMLVDWFRYTP